MKKVSHKGVTLQKPENISMKFIKFLIDNAEGHYGNLQPIIEKVSNMLEAKKIMPVQYDDQHLIYKNYD